MEQIQKLRLELKKALLTIDQIIAQDKPAPCSQNLTLEISRLVTHSTSPVRLADLLPELVPMLSGPITLQRLSKTLNALGFSAKLHRVGKTTGRFYYVAISKP